ncbi:MAG: hypothetical protein GX456_03480 [Verrucomicrobia bacterium]|nr:hypothetical protein [Verrucomicrobiota bacterium]
MYVSFSNYTPVCFWSEDLLPTVNRQPRRNGRFIIPTEPASSSARLRPRQFRNPGLVDVWVQGLRD